MRCLAALLHRDHDLERVECGVRDGFVLSRADVADLPCRDTATRLVVFHCPACGRRERVVCEHHEQVIAKGLGACEVCEQAGDLTPITYVQSGPVLHPQPKTSAKEAS